MATRTKVELVKIRVAIDHDQDRVQRHDCFR